MNKFLKELMILADDLNKSEGFNDLVIMDSMESLYKKHFAELESDLDVTIKLFEERQRVLDTLVEGSIYRKCVPSALNWIEKMKKKYRIR